MRVEKLEYGEQLYLQKSHRNSTIISASWQPARCTCSSCRRDTSFRWSIDLITTATQKTSKTGCSRTTSGGSTSIATKTPSEELSLLSRLLDVVLHSDATRCALVRRRCCTGAHKGGNHDRCVNGAVTLRAAERSCLTAGNLPISDDGSVGLRTAAAGRVVSLWERNERQMTYFDEQSRGVPSCTVKPGMITPLAPLISVTTPWAATEAVKATTSA